MWITKDNYFLDITYQTIPKKYKKYKLMTITCVDSKNNATNLCCLIAITYEDYLSIYYTLKYISQFYKFNPKIIHIDFSKAERKALIKENLFKNQPIVISCFFHFTQSIFRKMKEYKIIKSNLTKY